MNSIAIRSISSSMLLILLLACTGSGAKQHATLVTTEPAADTVVNYKQVPGYQMGNVINNAFALHSLQEVIRRADTAQTMINVLHIGDSHIKSGFYSQPFMVKLNEYYATRYHNNLFFNFQWFCKIGTKYSDYNDLAELDDQLISGQPNLVIISLGTNDAFSGSSQTNFYQKIDHLVQKIRSLAPHASLLITTPPDALKLNPRRRVYELLPELVNVVNTIIKYCTDKQIAFWNLHQIMGGNYSMNRWVSDRLAAPDHVHFTAQGYGMFSQWLFDAFTKIIN